MEKYKPTSDELIGQIDFLKNILEFYANKDNYANTQIIKDGGHQARFALEQIVVIDDLNKKMLNQVDEIAKKFNIEIDDNIMNDAISQFEIIQSKLNEYK